MKFRQHQELRWEEAVLALSVCDMNVEKAVCSIQCESLEPLYEFIFSEWTEVPATDMKKIKERLKKVEGEEEKTVSLMVLSLTPHSSLLTSSSSSSSYSIIDSLYIIMITL